MNPAGGGVAETIRLSSEQLVSLGHVVVIATLDHPDEDFIANMTIPIVPLGQRSNIYGYSREFMPWLALNYQQFDIVIIEGLWQYHGLATWKVLRKGPVPYYVFPHGMLDPWFKQTYPIKHLKKWVYWLCFEYRVLRDASAVLFTCQDELLLARESFSYYEAIERVSPLGIVGCPSTDRDASVECFLGAHPVLRQKRVVLFLSRIHEKKGCDLLISAFARFATKFPSLHLVFAGPDQEGWGTNLQTQASSLGIADRITWTGMLQGDMKWGAFFSAEVFCLPSHQENFGIVVAEALACGKPVLISNKVNIWREIDADQSGFVDADTLDGTVRNFERWLAMSPEEYVSMSKRGIDTFKKRFHIERAAAQLLDLVRMRG